MKKMSNSDFLLPLRNRPNLEPSEEFKKELWQELKSSRPKKNKLKIFQIPLLTGFAALLVLLIFSNSFQHSEESQKSSPSAGQSASFAEKADKKAVSDQAANNQDTSNQADHLAQYVNPKYRVTFDYNKEWKQVSGYTEKYEGKDGFFQVDAYNGANQTLDEVANNLDAHKLKPFGSKPYIQSIFINGREGRLILPSDDQTADFHNQAEVILKYPNVVEIDGNQYSYFLLLADKNHLQEIANTIQFIEK
jgi:hypothetical protein